MSAIYDNWERLVAGALKKQQIWDLCNQPSRSPSILSDASYLSSSFDISVPVSPSRSHNSPPKLVLLSEFSPAFGVKDAALASFQLLGMGTFGSAYVATIDDERIFVVKRLKPESISQLDFRLNMEIVGDVRHQNVVALRAYYSSAREKLMLYDYYSNGSVHSLLHGQTADVDWETRVKIAVGAARGIAEIHKQLGGMLVHGNIKASNIFLNEQLYGCVSDFGLTNMKRTTVIPTAKWYVPAIKNTQNVSHASDVYGFGILLLELLTRKTSAHIPGGPAAVNLVKLVNSVKSKERAANVFDSDLLKHPSISEQMIKMLQIGIKCVAKSAKKRPNIFQVVEMLEDIGILNRVSRSFYSTNREGILVFLEDSYPIFDLEDILGASAEVLGKGSIGTSYMVSLENGSIIVVKRLKNTTPTFKDFQQNVGLFGRTNHINVGRLKAYYFGRDERLLVYDYYSKGSIYALLHGTSGDPWISLDWGSRVDVALGAARGIAHMHRQGPKLVLGNIKSSNIFLNELNHSIVAFDAVLGIMITPEILSGVLYSGYCAPEVAYPEKMSQSSDVYSFGVVLLELVVGGSSQQFAEDGLAASLAGWVRSVYRSEWPSELLDVECLRYGDEQAMTKVLQIAAACVSTVPEDRPTIFEVVKLLEEISGVETLEEISEVEPFDEISEVETLQEISGYEPQNLVEDSDTWGKSSVHSKLEYLLENLLPMLSP